MNFRMDVIISDLRSLFANGTHTHGHRRIVGEGEAGEMGRERVLSRVDI